MENTTRKWKSRSRRYSKDCHYRNSSSDPIMPSVARENRLAPSGTDLAYRATLGAYENVMCQEQAQAGSVAHAHFNRNGGRNYWRYDHGGYSDIGSSVSGPGRVKFLQLMSHAGYVRWVAVFIVTSPSQMLDTAFLDFNYYMSLNTDGLSKPPGHAVSAASHGSTCAGICAGCSEGFNMQIDCATAKSSFELTREPQPRSDDITRGIQAPQGAMEQIRVDGPVSPLWAACSASSYAPLVSTFWVNANGVGIPVGHALYAGSGHIQLTADGKPNNRWPYPSPGMNSSDQQMPTMVHNPPPVSCFYRNGAKHYRCECGREIKRKGDMKRHQESAYHLPLQFGCICGKKFTRKDTRKCHEKKCREVLRNAASA
ncbi:hypothetical protein F5887DRAFT_1159305 [Amanita rubescens]|nr:hypothetical protein F5887DRAFT_1159305 [Amanita rubescens]